MSHVAQLEWEWVRDWTAELVRFVLADEEHGEANRAVLDGWLEDWLPLARAAARGARAGVRRAAGRHLFGDARANVESDVDELLVDCGLAEPAPAAEVPA